MLMLILGNCNKEEWKCWGKENKLNYFVEKNIVVEIESKEHANEKHLIRTKLLNKLDERPR